MCGQTALSRLSRGTAVPDSVVYGVAGGVATLFHDAIMTPAEGDALEFSANCVADLCVQTVPSTSCIIFVHLFK